ncbi:MAG: hypothetical protein GY757_43815 [bacterium]|nr:hypothetical protein [bacterium]
MTGNLGTNNLLSQDEVSDLLAISGFIHAEQKEQRSLIEEIKDAILDSAKLSLNDWKALRQKLKEIERLIPHIDLIIQLKGKVK